VSQLEIHKALIVILYVGNDPVNMNDPSGLMEKEGQPDPDNAPAKDEPPGDPFETGQSIVADAVARYDHAVAETMTALRDRASQAEHAAPEPSGESDHPGSETESSDQQGNGQQENAAQTQTATFEGLTVTVSAGPGRFDSNLPVDPSHPNDGPFFTGFGSVLTITLSANGAPVVGAKGTESVVGTKGEAVTQNPNPVSTDSRGQSFDMVTRGAFEPQKVNAAIARQVFRVNSENPVDVTTRQTLALKLPSGGSVQVMFDRRITNLDAKGNIRPAGQLVTGPAANYSVSIFPITIKRMP
jgi:hypothetical protein